MDKTSNSGRVWVVNVYSKFNQCLLVLHVFILNFSREILYNNFSKNNGFMGIRVISFEVCVTGGL